MNSSDLEALVRNIRAGGYSLLLGAGASFGGRNGQGQQLPLGNKFREELCIMQGAPISSPLQKIYETLTDDQIEEYVIKRFSNCEPSEALFAIPKFIWRRIFSLNVDDALEKAYSQDSRFQEAIVKNYISPYEESSDKATVQIIHLHGWVKKKEEGLVFSRDAYLRQIRKINPWMVVLTQSLAVDPFIILGTSLDEVDLDYYLSQRTHVSVRTDRGPSILVEVSDNVITKKDCEKYNLVHFPGTSNDFMVFLQGAVADRPTPRGLVSSANQSFFPDTVDQKQVLRFFSDFQAVPHIAEPALEDDRFMLGHAPSWSDLAAQIDVSRDGANRIVTDIEGFFAPGPKKAQILYLRADAGEGKTTVLRRVAYDFARGGTKVLLCSALSRLEADFTAAMLDYIDGPILIVVDNFADQAYPIGEIVRALEKPDVLFLVAERSYRDRYVMQGITGVTTLRRVGLPLQKREATTLIANYEEAGFLGTDAALKRKDQFLADISSDPIAVACCRIMNDMRPLDGIIDSLTAAATKTEYDRYLAVCIAQHCISGGLRYELMIAVAGGVALQQQMRSTHPLPLTLLDFGSEDYVVPLNSTVASRFLKRESTFKREKTLEIFIRIAKAIAPRVNREAIKRRSPEARLAGRLFDYDQVVLEFLDGDAARFYSAVQDDWKWNSRFWEQVALLHLGRYHANPAAPAALADLDLAVRHARHAVTIERHPLTLTTLGKVLLAEMHVANASVPAIFQEALTQLGNAISLERAWLRSNAQPYVSLFRGVREYTGLGYRLDNKQRQTLEEYIRHVRSAFSHDEDMQRMIQELAVF